MLGRYALYDELASGGMATVYFGRLLGPVGFARTVAIKCLHPQYAKDPQFVTMLLDEARLAARIQHPNVVSILDVVVLEGELFLVMEFVQGESLSKITRMVHAQSKRVPFRVALGIVTGVLYGLHAAHEARSERGEPLGLVHRDVSPQNIMVGLDGVARVLDFGVAKAAGRLQTTSEGEIKGKVAYMAPEQIRGKAIDRRTDIYAASVVLWETLTAHRLFEGENPAGIMNHVLTAEVCPPSRFNTALPKAIDQIVLRGLARDPAGRFATAREMATAIERTAPMPSPREIGDWVAASAGPTLDKRAEIIHEIESNSAMLPGMPDLGEPARSAASVSPAVGPSPSSGSGSGSQRPAVVRPQSTSASEMSLITPETPRRRLGVALAAGAVIGLVVIAVGIAVSSRVSRGGPPTASDSASSPPSDPSNDTPAASSTDAGVAPGTPSATTSAMASSSTSSRPARPPKHGGALGPPPTVRPSGDPTPSSNVRCSPPYTVDANGIRHPKPECL